MNAFQKAIRPAIAGSDRTFSKPRRRRLLQASSGLTVVAVATLTMTAAPAGATPATPSAAANSQSTFFAGYTVGGTPGPTVTSATTAFTVPSVTCPATGPNTGIFPMADIANSSGTFAQGGVTVICDTGHVRYEELARINNFMAAGAFFPVAHDKITVFVTQTSNGAEVLIKDLTQHKMQDFRGPVGAPTGGTDNTSAIGDQSITMNEAPVGNPPFGTITFSQDQTNGAALGAQPHMALNEATATTGGTLQIVTSKLNPAGTSFRTTFKHT